MQIAKQIEITPMQLIHSLRAYLITVAITWAVMIGAGIIYAQKRQIAAGFAVPIITAFLLEAPLYIAPFFASVRTAAARMNPWLLALGLAISAVLPYVVYTVPTHCFGTLDFWRLCGLAASLSFWYLVVPATIWSDLLFLAGPVAVLISRILRNIYGSPLEHEKVEILGHLMLIHVAAIAVLILRRLDGVNPGVIPTKREAWIGLRSFLMFLPLGLGLVKAMHLPWRAQPLNPAYALPIFAGTLVVTAWSEEFAVRGVVQQHLTKLLGPVAGIGIASALFGLAHINFRFFPNWPMVILAGVAGIFFGVAYWQAKSIRASMLTHALVVMVWTLWFR